MKTLHLAMETLDRLYEPMFGRVNPDHSSVLTLSSPAVSDLFPPVCSPLHCVLRHHNQIQEKER